MGMKAGPLDGLFKDFARLSLGAMGLGMLSVLCVATHLAATAAWATSPSVREASELSAGVADGTCACCLS